MKFGHIFNKGIRKIVSNVLKSNSRQVTFNCLVLSLLLLNPLAVVAALKRHGGV